MVLVKVPLGDALPDMDTSSYNTSSDLTLPKHLNPCQLHNVVSHPSTFQAQSCLASVFQWELVFPA